MNDDESNLPANRLWQLTTAKWVAVVFGGSVLYAIVRYHLTGDVEWRHFPVVILNKATSLAAVIFVAASIAALVPIIVRRRLIYERQKRETEAS